MDEMTKYIDIFTKYLPFIYPDSSLIASPLGPASSLVVEALEGYK